VNFVRNRLRLARHYLIAYVAACVYATPVPMRLAVCLLLATSSATAHADRNAVWSTGATFDYRAIAPSFAAAGTADGCALFGGRVAVGFEDDPVPMPPLEGVVIAPHLVPELLVGFVSDQRHAEGYAGAGLRGEIDFASNRHAVNLRTGIYAAARAIVIGPTQDPAAEFVIGEWLSRGADRRRFGWEGGAMVRPRADGAPNERELDALLTVYASFR
jgi:hypothetical protein